MNFRNNEISQLQPRGQITIPSGLRRELGLEAGSPLRIGLENGRLVVTPVTVVENSSLIRLFSASKIRQFIKEDQLSPNQSASLKKLVQRGR